MDRGALLLNDLRTKLQRDHVARLRRALHADVTVEVAKNGEFTMVVTPMRSGAPVYKKLFTRQLVFAGTFHLSPHAWAVEKRACDYATDILRETLEQRGVA